MGLRGPNKKPTALKRAQGTPRHKLNKNEPEPPNGDAVCPRSLSKDAKPVWKRLAPQLMAMGVLAIIDTDVLARYCEVWVQWRKATDAIASEGMTLDGRQRAVVKIAREAGAEMTRLETCLGMSPSARASLSVAPKKSGKDEESLEDFIASKPRIVKGSAG